MQWKNNQEIKISENIVYIPARSFQTTRSTIICRIEIAVKLCTDLLKKNSSAEMLYGDEYFKRIFSQIVADIHQYKIDYKNSLENLKFSSNKQQFQIDTVLAIKSISVDLLELIKNLIELSEANYAFDLGIEFTNILLNIHTDVEENHQWRFGNTWHDKFYRILTSFLACMGIIGLKDNEDETYSEKFLTQSIETLISSTPGDKNNLIGYLVIPLIRTRVNQGWLEAAKSLYLSNAKRIPPLLIAALECRKLAKAFVQRDDIINGIFFYEQALTIFLKTKEKASDKTHFKQKILSKIANLKIQKAISLLQKIKERFPSQLVQFDDDSVMIFVPHKNKILTKQLIKHKVSFEWNDSILTINNLYKISEAVFFNLLNIISNNHATKKPDTPSIAQIQAISSSTSKCEQEDNNKQQQDLARPKKVKSKNLNHKVSTHEKDDITKTQKLVVNFARFFSDPYKDYEIISFGNQYIPEGIYCGFFQPTNPEKVTASELKHHKEILSRGKIVSGFFQQGIKFVKNKHGKVNSFKTKDPSQDFRLHSSLIETTVDKEGRKHYLYQFGTFRRHGE